MNSSMLEDNSVTNIFSLKGISKIRWKRYYYLYKIDKDENNLNLFQSLNSGLSKDPIISTYLNLIENGTLCIWINGQYNENDENEGKPTKLFSKSSNLKLNDLMDISKTNEQQKDEGKDIKEKSKELWLFQFDNELDVDQKELENLIELETGEFNFETLNTLYIQDSNYEFIEYHLFIKAIYNLLERNFYKHGIFRLGDHFIFTEIPQENYSFMYDITNDTNGLLSCQIIFTYTASNLLLQPVIRQHQFLRSIELQDIDLANKITNSNIKNEFENDLKINGINNTNTEINHHSNIFVLLSPHGIPAYLYSSEMQYSYEFDYILEEWSKCFGIPKEKLYYENKKHEMPLIVTVFIPEINSYINYPTKCIYIVDSKNTFNISRKLCYNPRIYHQFNEFIWRDQSIHDNSLIFSGTNNSIKYESNDIINQVANVNNKLNNGLVDVKKENDKTINNLSNNMINNLAKENKDIDFFNYVIPEKKLLTELIKEEKIIKEIDEEAAASINNNNNNGINNNISGKGNYPGTPININKVNTPYNSQQSSSQKKNNKSPTNTISVPSKNQKPKEEKKRKMPADNKKAKKEKKEVVEVKVEKPVALESNPQVEDNYVMSGIFNDSNFDDFGDWETGIEITDKDFDFFDDKPSQSKTISDMDFGMDDMLTDPVIDNSNKQSSFNSLSQNTLTNIKIEEKDNLDIKNSLPSTPLNQDIETPSSLNLNNKVTNSIQNSPDMMSMSPANSILSPQTVPPNNIKSNDLIKNSPSIASSPLVNNQSQNVMANDITNSNNILSSNEVNNNTITNGTNENGKVEKNNVSSQNKEINNSNVNTSSPMANDTQTNDDDLTIPHEWELKNSNQAYFNNLVEKYHKGKWSYEPKLTSYLISFKRKKISKKDLYRYVMSKRIKYKEDIDINGDKSNAKKLEKDIKKENENKEENTENVTNKKIKLEDGNENQFDNEDKENKDANISDQNNTDNNNNNNNNINTDNNINKITVDYGSAWKMLNIYEYNPINDIIEKSLINLSLESDLIYNNIKIKDEPLDNLHKIKQENNIENKNILEKVAQKVFIDQYTGSLSSWNKSLEHSLSAITFSEENELYDEHMIPSLASKALNQLQIIFEDLFGSDIDQKFSMKNMYIEGPLTIKQLYDSEHSQHAKYGKYQVKKKTKKNIDYVLEKLSTPDIIVENNSEWVKLSSTSLRFWDKIGILPYSGKKNISWFALCPTMKEMNGEPNMNSDLINIVREWFQNLSYIYESSNFGTHTQGNLNPIKGIIPCCLDDNSNNSTIENILTSYERAISYFASMMSEDIHGIIEEGEATTMSEIDECLNNDQKYIVLYLLNPFSSSDKTYINKKEEKQISYKFCQMFVNSFLYKLAISTRLSIEKLRSKIILQIIPLDLIANNHSFDGYVIIGLKDLVFTLYSKCRKLLQKNININNTEYLISNDLYQPPYILSQTAIPIPHFTFRRFSRKRQIKNRVNIMEPDRILHIAYTTIDDRIVACMTDQIGELFDIVLVDDSKETLNSIASQDYEKYTKQQIRFIKVWEKAMKIILFGCNFYWRIAIIKIGHVLQNEINDWEFISSTYLGKLQHLYHQPSLKIINNLNEQIYSVSILGIYKNSSFQIFKEKIKSSANGLGNLNPLARRDSDRTLSSSQSSLQTPKSNSSKNEMNELNDIAINFTNSCYTYIHSVQRSPSFPSNPEIIWPLLSSKYSTEDNLALPLSIGWMIYTPSMESKQIGINTKNFEILLLSHQHSNILKPNKTCFPTWNPTIPTTPISMPNSPSSSTSIGTPKNNNNNPPTLVKSNSVSIKDINSSLSMMSSASSISLNGTTSMPYNVILSDLIKQYFSLSFLEMHWSNLINTANGCSSDDLRLPIHISTANRISKILKGFYF